MFTTALETGEIITEVRFPVPERANYQKFRQPASRFALVGVFVAKFPDGVRVAVTGASESGVFRWTEAEAALSADFRADAIKGLKASADGMIGDLHGTPEYRAHLIGVLTGGLWRRDLGPRRWSSSWTADALGGVVAKEQVMMLRRLPVLLVVAACSTAGVVDHLPQRAVEVRPGAPMPDVTSFLVRQVTAHSAATRKRGSTARRALGPKFITVWFENGRVVQLTTATDDLPMADDAPIATLSVYWSQQDVEASERAKDRQASLAAAMILSNGLAAR